jgi:hypothetical protein
MTAFIMGGVSATLSEHIEFARSPNGEVPGSGTYSCAELMKLMRQATQAEGSFKTDTLGDFFFGALVKKASVGKAKDFKKLKSYFYQLAPRLPVDVRAHMVKRAVYCRDAFEQDHRKNSPEREPKLAMVAFILKALAPRDPAPKLPKLKRKNLNGKALNGHAQP